MCARVLPEPSKAIATALGGGARPRGPLRGGACHGPRWASVRPSHSESAQGSTVLVWGCLKIWGPPKFENMGSPKMAGFVGFPLESTQQVPSENDSICAMGKDRFLYLGLAGMALKSPGKDP